MTSMAASVTDPRSILDRDGTEVSGPASIKIEEGVDGPERRGPSGSFRAIRILIGYLGRGTRADLGFSACRLFREVRTVYDLKYGQSVQEGDQREAVLVSA